MPHKKCKKLVLQFYSPIFMLTRGKKTDFDFITLREM